MNISAETTEKANCYGMNPKIFFTTPGQNLAPLKDICLFCPIKIPCLDEALLDNSNGFRGGASERERIKIRNLGLTATEFFNPQI